jgi:hypothetical protein
MTSPFFDDEPHAQLSRKRAEGKAQQKRYPRRKPARIDVYFESYEHELKAREDRQHREKSTGRCELTHRQPWHYCIDGSSDMYGTAHLRALPVIAKPAFCAIVQRGAGQDIKRARVFFPHPVRHWSFVPASFAPAG